MIRIAISMSSPSVSFLVYNLSLLRNKVFYKKVRLLLIEDDRLLPEVMLAIKSQIHNIMERLALRVRLEIANYSYIDETLKTISKSISMVNN